jgi:peptidoglycan L-alanyl-D-glutamate endopeptidase CwlK
MPYPVSWTDVKRIYYFAGIVMGTAAAMGIKVRWGGDFSMDQVLDNDPFIDAPHYELIHA